MATTAKSIEDLKQKVHHGMVEYAVNVAYLTLVFAAFTQYRRLVLAAHDITYTNYWVAFIEAMVLGKVIMIGGVFGLGKGLEDKPLIFPALYKSAVFALLVGIVELFAKTIRSWWSGEGLAGMLVSISSAELNMLLANSLALLAAFIPFFAMRELGRVFGNAKMFELFFQGRRRA